ncbi:hypothetical protein GN956_G26569, partial [Arapaima gigas]
MDALVSTLCLPHGELRLSCSATGHRPQYNWTLKDRPLGSGSFDDGNGVIILKKNESGDVTCTAWNHISKANTTLTLPTCTDLGPPVKCSNGTGITVTIKAGEDLSHLDNKNVFLSLAGREMLSTLCYKPISTTKPPKLATCWKESAVFVVSAVLAVVSVLLAATVAVYYGKRHKTKGEANRDVQE